MTEPYRNTVGQSVRQGLSRLLGAAIYQSPYGAYQTVANRFNPAAGWSESQYAASQMMNTGEADYNSYMRSLLRNDPGYTGDSPSQPTNNSFSGFSNPFAGMFSRRAAQLPSYAQNYSNIPVGNYLQGNTAWGQSVAPSWNIGDTTSVMDQYTGGPQQNPFNGQGMMRAPTVGNRVGSLAGGSITSRSPYGMAVEGDAAREMFQGMKGPSHSASVGETTNILGGVQYHAR